MATHLAVPGSARVGPEGTSPAGTGAAGTGPAGRCAETVPAAANPRDRSPLTAHRHHPAVPHHSAVVRLGASHSGQARPAADPAHCRTPGPTAMSFADPHRTAPHRTAPHRIGSSRTGPRGVGWGGTVRGWFASSGRGRLGGGRTSRRRTSCSGVVRVVLRRAWDRRGTRAGAPCSRSTTWATGHPRRDDLLDRRAGRPQPGPQPVRVPGVGSSCPTSKLLMTSLGVAVNVVLPALFSGCRSRAGRYRPPTWPGCGHKT
jgi:hypothetical protein